MTSLLTKKANCGSKEIGGVETWFKFNESGIRQHPILRQCRESRSRSPSPASTRRRHLRGVYEGCRRPPKGARKPTQVLGGHRPHQHGVTVHGNCAGRSKGEVKAAREARCPPSDCPITEANSKVSGPKNSCYSKTYLHNQSLTAKIYVSFMTRGTMSTMLMLFG